MTNRDVDPALAAMTDADLIKLYRERRKDQADATPARGRFGKTPRQVAAWDAMIVVARALRARGIEPRDIEG